MTNSTKKAGTMNEPEPELIELTDIVDGNVAGDFEDEDIIELTNIVDENSSYDELTTVIELTDIVGKEEEEIEDEVLDLTDIVNGEVVDKQKVLDDGEEEFVEVDEDYVEVADEPFEADGEIDDSEDSEEEFDLEDTDDFDEEEPEAELVKQPAMEFDLEKVKELVRKEIGVQLADIQDVKEEKDDQVELEVEPKEIEAAIEKIVQEKFSDNIESVLFSVIEKVMEKEISEVKKNLEQNLDDIIKS